jgi:hypothetical protein
MAISETVTAVTDSFQPSEQGTRNPATRPTAQIALTFYLR